MAQKGKRVFRVSGRVINRETRHGIEGLRVEAWDKDLICSDLVGSAITDEQGAFQIEFDESYFSELFQDQQPELFFKIFREGTLIASTADEVLWNVEAGDTWVVIEVDLPAAKEPEAKPLAGGEIVRLAVSGILINAANGYALSGLCVKAYLVEPDALNKSKYYHGDGQSECLLGEGVSDLSGRFEIAFRNSETVRRRLFLLTGYKGSYFVLKVESSTGKLYHLSDPLSISSRFPVTLSVALPAQRVAPATWRTLGERIEGARLAYLHDLARELGLTAPPQSLFSDWDLETRQSVLTELEQAFLDPQGVLRDIAMPPGFYALRVPGALEKYQERLQPQLKNPRVSNALAEMRGKVESFSDLFAVDWLVDPSQILKGNPGAAIQTFQHLYQIATEGVADPGKAVIIQEPATDLSRYRDYLRAIWISVSTQVEIVRPHKLNATQSMEQLTTRFHQDFTTLSAGEQPVNEILIRILTNVLAAPTGSDFGFGIPAGSIPAQGQRTSRQYLDHLIGLTRLSAHELGLRYRLDLERPDSILSNEVQENINTLWRFFRDSFQCQAEPVHVNPDVLNEPIIPPPFQGRALFFLEYEEWLRSQAPFYAENFYQLRQAFHLEMSAEQQNSIKGTIISRPELKRRGDWKFFEDCLAVEALLVRGYNEYDHSRYPSALDNFDQAMSLAITLFKDPVFNGLDFQAEFLNRKASPMKNIDDLQVFMNRYRASPVPLPGQPRQDYEDWIAGNQPTLAYALIYLAVYVLPICIADAKLAQGDYPTAVFNYGRTTRLLVGKAKGTDTGGYRPYYLEGFSLYHAGNLPYTVDLQKVPADFFDYPLLSDDDSLYWIPGFPTPPDENDAKMLVRNLTHPMEVKFFRLRQGDAMLEWADALYRTDDPSNIARARELYKGVLWLHGETPPICPTWDSSRLHPGLGFINHSENPTLVSQKVRASKGFFQIEAELNYYGYRDDMVPTLRYRPLKDAADRFAAFAKSAQQDFLAYMEKLEDATIEAIKNSAMLRKAALQSQVAGEQAKIAQDGVTLAKIQITQVNQAIEAKQKEIDDHDSLFTQFTDYVEGMMKIVKDLPDDTKSSVSSGIQSEAGISAMKGDGFLGLGTAGSVMGGFGIFAVASYMTMSSMEGAANQRSTDLAKLKDQALPAATTQLDIKKREVTIASLQQQIAQADGDLAKDLITFQSNRFLSIEFWSSLANVMRRVLRRYLELGSRTAWLAERALAYEQDRSINIIRFDYFPVLLRNVTGADLMQLDLAELEASRLDGIKETIPIKHTFSLARDFPLQFGQLKKTGRCTFKTEELPFQFAYPGTYNDRIRAVTVTVNNVAVTNPVRGLLRNQGISLLSRLNQNNEEETHVSVRPVDALPISEFRLSNDMAVYSLPDEALLPFEGGGVETFWELEFSAVANPYGLANVADILLTFDIRAHYSSALYQQHILSMPSTVRRFVFASSQRHQPQSIVALHSATDAVIIDFDMTAIGLPLQETNQKVKNLVLFLTGEAPLTFTAILASASTRVDVSFEKSIALSNAPPLSNSQSSAPSPLNALVDEDVAQTFRLRIDKRRNPGVDFSKVNDVILGVEYSADIK